MNKTLFANNSTDKADSKLISGFQLWWSVLISGSNSGSYYISTSLFYQDKKDLFGCITRAHLSKWTKLERQSYFEEWKDS